MVFLDCCLLPFCFNSFDLICNDHQTHSIYSFRPLIPNYTSKMQKQEQLFNTDKRYKVAFEKSQCENSILNQKLKDQNKQIKRLKMKIKNHETLWEKIQKNLKKLFKSKPKKRILKWWNNANCPRPLKKQWNQRRLISMLENWYSISEICMHTWRKRSNIVEFIRIHKLKSLVKNWK